MGDAGRHPKELDLNNIPKSLYRKVSVSIKYTKPNGSEDTTIIKPNSVSRIYFENELYILKEDVKNLNEILDLKNQQRKLLQQYIDKKLETWNYRGEIKI